MGFAVEEAGDGHGVKLRGKSARCVGRARLSQCDQGGFPFLRASRTTVEVLLKQRGKGWKGILEQWVPV